MKDSEKIQDATKYRLEAIKFDEDDLPFQEELADNLLITSSMVEISELNPEDEANMIHLFIITQTLIKVTV